MSILMKPPMVPLSRACSAPVVITPGPAFVAGTPVQLVSRSDGWFVQPRHVTTLQASVFLSRIQNVLAAQPVVLATVYVFGVPAPGAFVVTIVVEKVSTTGEKSVAPAGTAGRLPPALFVQFWNCVVVIAVQLIWTSGTSGLPLHTCIGQIG